MSRTSLRAGVGFFLGYGRGADYGETAYTAEQDATIEQVVASGLRRFYFPPQATGFYDWSFLRPVGTLTLPDATATIALPDDFGGIQGPITCTASGTAGVWWGVYTANEAQVRQSFAALPGATGRPLQAAVVPLRGTGLLAGERFSLAVYPTPDRAYTLRFAYTVLPDALTGTRPLPLGGAVHAETILESCLAVAEERLDDAVGVHARQFDRLLQASMGQDKRMKPQQLGPNRDDSDWKYGGAYDRPLNPVLVGGQLYGP